MERRFTAFLLPLVLVLGLVFWMQSGDQNGKAGGGSGDGSLPSQPVVQGKLKPRESTGKASVWHSFGEPGKHGYTVLFSRWGAGVRAILMHDHFVTPEVRERVEAGATPERSELYPIVGEYLNADDSAYFGLVLEERSSGRKGFARDIAGSNGEKWDFDAMPDDADRVRFSMSMGDGLTLHKVFSYEEGRRDLRVDIELTSEKDAQVGKDEAEFLLWLRGLEVWNPVGDNLIGNPARAMARLTGADGAQEVFQQAGGAKPFEDLAVPSGTDQFDVAGTSNRFFGAFLYSNDEASRKAVERVQWGTRPPSERRTSTFTIAAHSVPVVRTGLRLPRPAKGETAKLSFRMYLGPKSSWVFEENAKTAAEYERFRMILGQDLTPPCCGIPGVPSLARGLIWLLHQFHSLVGNWGVAIILLTLLVRGLMSPLNYKMQKNMRIAGQKMAVLKPKIEAIQKKYEKDPKVLQQETMKLYREHKVFSSQAAGCLPILMTMPVWIGLFTALRVMYELRHEGFIGYINDLSTADHLVALPFWPDWFNLLPILMVGLWLVLQMGTPLPSDPQQRQMMKIMRLMPLLFGVMLYKYASGLMIYMITSSIWGIFEQRITKKILGPINPDAPGAGMTPMV